MGYSVCNHRFAGDNRPEAKRYERVTDGISLKDYPNIKRKAEKDIHCFFFTGLFYMMMAAPGPVRARLLCKVTGKSPEEAARLLYRRATWKSWKG